MNACSGLFDMILLGLDVTCDKVLFDGHCLDLIIAIQCQDGNQDIDWHNSLLNSDYTFGMKLIIEDHWLSNHSKWLQSFAMDIWKSFWFKPNSFENEPITFQVTYLTIFVGHIFRVWWFKVTTWHSLYEVLPSLQFYKRDPSDVVQSELSSAQLVCPTYCHILSNATQ